MALSEKERVGQETWRRWTRGLKRDPDPPHSSTVA
jgi:hypothetical protein